MTAERLILAIIVLNTCCLLAGTGAVLILYAQMDRLRKQRQEPCSHCLHWLHSIHNTNVQHDTSELVTYQMCCQCGTVFGTVNGAMAPHRRLEHGPHLIYARTRE